MSLTTLSSRFRWQQQKEMAELHIRIARTVSIAHFSQACTPSTLLRLRQQASIEIDADRDFVHPGCGIRRFFEIHKGGHHIMRRRCSLRVS